MTTRITVGQLRENGMNEETARALVARLAVIPPDETPAQRWSVISRDILTRDIPFDVHRLLYNSTFGGLDAAQAPPAAWTPTQDDIDGSNIAQLCAEVGLQSYDALHRWSCDHRADFWQTVIRRMNIRFATPPSATLDLSNGVESPVWLPDARLNIADSCFQAPATSPAVVYQSPGADIQTMSVGELNALSNRVALALARSGLSAGDRIAIAMPMTLEAVAAYIGIVKAGGVVVSIADSFSPEEIATRLRISQADTVVTQDVILRGGKTLPMYQRVVDSGARCAIVIPASDTLRVKLRDTDREWRAFLVDDDAFHAVMREPSDPINILFSSGTTGDPKAIPWDHTTPIKCAMDGHLHQDIQPGDVVAWPTNLGWMMGPWLIFASLLNRATMALSYDAPGTREFCTFVHEARVQMLGVVPSIVKAWRKDNLADGLDWSSIRCFSSTGEASNAEDYLYLMALAGYRPVIEYCGGTEIGGGYISGTVVQPSSPATFSTASLGLDLCLLDENGNEAQSGEVFLVPPSIGLSTTLLNRDHHEVYYKDTPTGPPPAKALLRRHGDQMERLAGGYYRAQGRADDTMNLSGIKVSSAEIERAVSTVDGIIETAAIAVNPADGGPSQLVIFAVPEANTRIDPDALRAAMQKAVAKTLNPLFKIYDVVTIEKLPRTASNKVMRRVLRSRYKAA